MQPITIENFDRSNLKYNSKECCTYFIDDVEHYIIHRVHKYSIDKNELDFLACNICPMSIDEPIDLAELVAFIPINEETTKYIEENRIKE